MRVLLTQVGARYCAVPIEHVVEILRPLPIESVSHALPFVLGVAVIRGAATPVLDAGGLMGGALRSPGRFVALKIGARAAALAVDAVVGVRVLSESALDQLPPLLDSALIASIGVLDSNLLLVLRCARLVPDELWAALEKVA